MSEGKILSVSVVIPAFNAGAFIEDALNSVLRQDILPNEIVVVNDGSTDRDYNELTILSPIIKVVNQANRGVSAARNLGCDIAESEYLSFLDADDVWLPGKQRIQLTYLSQNRDVDAVFCRGLLWRRGSSQMEIVTGLSSPDFANQPPKITRLYYRDFLYGIPVANPTIVLKKAAWKAIGGFDETKRYAEDQDFNLRLSRSHKVYLIDFFAMLYRQHAHNATAKLQDENHWATLLERTIDKFGMNDCYGISADPSRVQHHLARIHFMHGYSHFWFGQVGIARHEFLQALRKRCTSLRSIVYLFLAAIPTLPILIRPLRSLLDRLSFFSSVRTPRIKDETGGILKPNTGLPDESERHRSHKGDVENYRESP